MQEEAHRACLCFSLAFWQRLTAKLALLGLNCTGTFKNELLPVCVCMDNRRMSNKHQVCMQYMYIVQGSFLFLWQTWLHTVYIIALGILKGTKHLVVFIWLLLRVVLRNCCYFLRGWVKGRFQIYSIKSNQCWTTLSYMTILNWYGITLKICLYLNY